MYTSLDGEDNSIMSFLEKDLSKESHAKLPHPEEWLESFFRGVSAFQKKLAGVYFLRCTLDYKNECFWKVGYSCNLSQRLHEFKRTNAWKIKAAWLFVPDLDELVWSKEYLQHVEQQVHHHLKSTCEITSAIWRYQPSRSDGRTELYGAASQGDIGGAYLEALEEVQARGEVGLVENDGRTWLGTVAVLSGNEEAAIGHDAVYAFKRRGKG